MDNRKDVNRRTGSRNAWTMEKMSTDVQAVVERLLWIVTACGMPFEAVRRMASRKLLRFTTVFRPLLALLSRPSIVHALLDRVDGCARPTRFATSLTLCHARRSAETFTRLSLCGAILKYIKIRNFFFDVTVTENWVG